MKRREFLKVGGVGLAASTVAAPAIAQSIPGGEVAVCDQLAEVARYAVWRLRVFCQARRRDHRQPFPDSTVRRRRTRAGLAGARRGFERHRRDRQYGAVLLLGQEPGVYLRHVAAVRAQHPPAYLVAEFRRRSGHAQRPAQGIQLLRHSDRQHRRANGRLVPQGDQVDRRSQGPEIPRRRICRHHHCARSAAFRSRSRRAISIRRWRKAPSTPPSGSALTTTRSSASSRWRNITTIRAGGKAPARATTSSTSRNGTRCRSIIRRRSTRASRDTFTWVTGKYDYVNPPALKRLVGAGALLRPFPQEVLETCYKAANEIYAELSKSNPHFGKMHASLAAYRSESLAWMQVAELSFDSFMMRMRTRA